MRSSGEPLKPSVPPLLPEELQEDQRAGLVLASSSPLSLPLGQHSSWRPSASKTLKNIKEALSYSRWITKAPSARQTPTISPQPRVMKTLPGVTTATSAPVAGVLQPELQGPARWHLEGEGGRKADPRSWRHGGVKHKLAGGAPRVDSRGDDAHHCDSPASAATLSVLLGALPPGAYDAGVQGQRKPRRRPLVPQP